MAKVHVFGKKTWPKEQRKNVVKYVVKLLRAAWWMPWHRKAKKDALTCEKLRGAGKKL
jgi:hypothetical protein